MIRAYIGMLGSGKTLSMVRDLYIDSKGRNKKILSNLALNFKYEELNKEFFDNFSSGNLSKGLNDVCIGIDELHIFMDSRKSMSKKNRLMSYFILQTRKRNVTLRLTTQFFTQIDLRIRDVTDYITECSSFIKEGNNLIEVSPLMISRGLTSEQQNNLWIKNKTYLPNGKLLNNQMFEAKPYFNKYDTNQIIDFENE